MRILIVEDDSRVSSFLVRGLKAEGYSVQLATDGEQGLALAIEEKPEVIILDRMLPLLDGIDVLLRIREHKINTKILMLSALGNLEDKVKGLKMGADDYLSKPFQFEELLARIQALGRRDYTQEKDRVLVVGDLTLNLESLKVIRAKTDIQLTAKELAILELLMSSPQKVFSRERILANVWDAQEDPMTNVVDVYIKRLRNKIDVGFEKSYIKTFRGVGYSISSED